MSDLTKEQRERLSNRLIRLGDMMGDGEHYENPEISREYKAILKQLEPEIFANKRKIENENRNKRAEKYCAENDCPQCSGKLKQTRKGGLVLQCQGECKSRYKIRKRCESK